MAKYSDQDSPWQPEHQKFGISALSDADFVKKLRELFEATYLKQRVSQTASVAPRPI